MKIELNNNKVFYKNGTSSEEIHPFWLRERANGEKHLDKGTQQRLFDPTSLDVEVQIKDAQITSVEVCKKYIESIHVENIICWIRFISMSVVYVGSFHNNGYHISKYN